MAIRALRSTAQRIRDFRAGAGGLENEFLRLVRRQAPGFLQLLGVGLVTAVQVLVSRWHRGRFRSEGAFASFGGVAPVPASSGLTGKHRFNRAATAG